MHFYEEALKIDKENELSIANKSLIELKEESYEKCISSCNEAISKIDRLTHYTNFG